MKQVFIGGCHRSGTTLVGAMLGTNLDCLTIPEAQFKVEALGSCGIPENSANVKRALDMIIRDWRFKKWGMSIVPESVPMHEIGNSYGRLFDWLVKKYGEFIGKNDFRVWVDHTPRNIRHLYTLLTIFPEAKAIHIVRDGRAVAASVMPLDWGPNTIIGAAHWWVHNVSYGLAAESALGKDRIIRVRYEDLVMKTETVLRALCKWIGLEYNPRMAKGGGFNPISSAEKYHGLIRKPPDMQRINAWERELTSKKIEIFENHTEELLLYLGYELKSGLRKSRGSEAEFIKTMVVEPFMTCVNIIRFNYWKHKTDR